MFNVEMLVFGIVVAFGMVMVNVFPSLVAPVITALNVGM